MFTSYSTPPIFWDFFFRKIKKDEWDEFWFDYDYYGTSNEIQYSITYKYEVIDSLLHFSNTDGQEFIFHPSKKNYSKDFIDTKIKLGSPKYAFIPIGAYDPEWFMAESHVNPEDAVQIMLDLEAEQGFGMHWATFTLTDEDTLEPKQRLLKATQNNNNLNFI